MNNEISTPITDVRRGEYKLYQNGIGDTWDPAWAEDDHLYSPGNDGSGWDNACSSNLFFNWIIGDDPLTLTGQTMNGMVEYGGWAKEGPDGCTWKSSGCVSIDGTLYLGVARHQYGTKSGDPFKRQTARRASIIKSTDHGANWVRSATENYDNPMFPGSRFATPYFIYYGQDGRAPAVDGAERFIYAISNNGFWCNGDNYILGRAERIRIGRLDASDWTFYTGGDGLQDANWSPHVDEAALIIDNPLQCGETGATYLPSIGRYILVAWFYPGDPNVETDETHFLYYEAPKPWGPWIQIREDVIWPEGWYCPRVLSKWQQANGHEVDTVLVTGGDYYEMAKYYRFTVMALELKTDGQYPTPPAQPKPIIVKNTDVGEGLHQVRYEGTWRYDNTRQKALGGGEHYSDHAGDSFTITFHGSRLKWFSSKENNMGIASVSMDGGEETAVDLYTYCVVPQYSRQVYDSGLLGNGTHTFRVSVTGQKNEKSKGVLIFSDWVEITS